VSRAVLEVEELSVTFATRRGRARAVDGASFTVAAGETLAVVGESGSGKSATQLAVFDLLPRPPAEVSARALRLEGRELAPLPPAARRALCGKRMAMVFQDPQSALHPMLTVERQLSEVLELHEGLSRAAARERALAALDDVGLPAARERLDALPGELSGGMRQRVAIALALIARPALVVADEPTTALDVTLQAQVLDLFRALQRERALALVLVTHSLGVVARAADRVLVMYAGRIVESGPVDAVLGAPRHPYTRALLASVPRLDAAPGGRLAVLGGHPPDPARLPPGCAFAPRCPWRTGRCERERPELQTDGTGAERAVACVRASELAGAAWPGASA
jgi:oligopeptide/dipeptide ABC transporter ATP-binding protein